MYNDHGFYLACKQRTSFSLSLAPRFSLGLAPALSAENEGVANLLKWIIGVGVIPAVVALWFRLTIIESPRYTADVGRDTRKAASELDRYLLMQTAGLSTMSVINNQEGHPLRRISTDSGVASDDGSPEPDRSRSPYEVSPPPPNDHGDGNGFGKSTVVRSISIHSGAASEERHVSGASSPTYQQRNTNQSPEVHFLEVPQLEAAEEIHTPPAPSWKDFKQYFWHEGNLRTLIATSFCWFCVDLPFYGLGMNSPKIISTIWYGENPPPTQIYSLITHNVWQSLVIVSMGAIIGCAITFVAIDKLGRRNIQINGFFWLFILFVVIGGSFNHLYQIGGTSAIIVLYILCQIFFNFGMYSFLINLHAVANSSGPNTTTYIVGLLLPSIDPTTNYS